MPGKSRKHQKAIAAVNYSGPNGEFVEAGHDIPDTVRAALTAEEFDELVATGGAVLVDQD